MATYFAQAAGAIQSIEWDTVPTGGGTDLTWPPAADDVLCANGKALTWAAADVPTLTCARLSTTGEGTGTPGGGFTLSGSTAVAITADIVAGTTTCLTSTHTGTGVNAVTVNGNVTGGSATNAIGAQNNGAGTLTITGAVTGGSASTAIGARNYGTGTITIYTGPVTGGSVSGAHGAVNQNPGTLTINGDVTGGSASTAHGAWNNSTGTLTITGNVTGGSATNAHGAWNNSTGTLTITGAVTGGSATNAYGAQNNGAGTITIYTGPVTGGSVPNAIGAWNQSTGTITVNGNVSASSTARAFGAASVSTGAFTVIGSLIDTELCSAYTGAIFWQPASMAHYHQTPWNGSYNFRYTVPPMAQNVRDGVQRGYMLEVPDNGTLQIPAEADVKLGVGYGGGGTEFEGTLAAGGGGVPLIGPGGLVG